MEDNGKYSSSDEKPIAFTANQVRQLSHREHVRIRPGMYIGGTDLRALHHMVYVVLDNAAEAAFLGACTEITLTLKDNQVITIQDNAPGIPVDISPSERLPFLEVLLTHLGTTRYTDKGDRNYPISGGIHGLGLAPVNALSEWMSVETTHNGSVWQQRYEAGISQTPVKLVKHTTQDAGTTFTFRPDFSIFQPNEFHFRTLVRRCYELAYLIPNLRVTLRDQRQGKKHEVTYYAAEGIKTFILERLHQRHPLHPIIHTIQDVELTSDQQTFRVGIEFAMLFTTRKTPLLISYNNTVITPDGGNHLEGLRNGIRTVINENHRSAPLTRQQIEPGLIAVVSTRHPDPQFESPTKVKLMNPEVYTAVFQVVTETLRNRKAEWLSPVLEKMIR